MQKSILVRGMILVITLMACSRGVHKTGNVSTSNELPPQSELNQPQDGLSETARRQLFEEFCEYQRWAFRIVDEKYPIRGRDRGLPNRTLTIKRNALSESLLAPRKKEMAAKHKVSVDQIDEIYREGVQKGWWMSRLKPQPWPLDRGWRIPEQGPI